MNSVEDFIKAWPQPVNIDTRIAVSRFGNINRAGLSGVHEADDLAPQHPQWERCLEPKVKDIVQLLVGGFALMTYDSCEGHDYGKKRGFTHWHIGLLPRSHSEDGRLRRLACGLSEQARDELQTSKIAMRAGRDVLLSRVSGVLYPTVDFYLTPQPGGTAGEYFHDLPRAVAIFETLLIRQGHDHSRWVCAHDKDGYEAHGS
jgi:uncharacterized protein